MNKLIVLSVFLTACGTNPSSPGKPRALMLAGQSNMHLFEDYGLVHRFSDEWKEQISLIPPIPVMCAVKELGINDWQEGTPNFDKCLESAKGYDVVGLLWYQGEQDTSEHFAPEYAERVAAMVSAFRSHWGMKPFVFAQLAVTLDGRPHWDEIKTEQVRSLSLIPNSAMVETASWAVIRNEPTLGHPNVHLTYESDIELARRFIETLKRLL